jgi:hypothetical protein
MSDKISTTSENIVNKNLEKLKNPEKKDKRVINLWNYQNFSPEILDILKSITRMQSFKNLSFMRDQIIAHQDVSNRSNMFPKDRIRSRLSPSYVEGLGEILNLCIKAYCICMPSFTEKYYINDDGAIIEIKEMLRKAPPELRKLN